MTKTRRERTVKPTTPGEMLEARFLKPLELTQQAFADHIGCDVKTINRLIKGHSSVTPALALKLAAAFEMTPQFWLNLQANLDIYEARQAQKSLPSSLIKEKMVS